jgi:hypothetical protein
MEEENLKAKEIRHQAYDFLTGLGVDMNSGNINRSTMSKFFANHAKAKDQERVTLIKNLENQITNLHRKAGIRKKYINKSINKSLVGKIYGNKDK